MSLIGKLKSIFKVSKPHKMWFSLEIIFRIIYVIGKLLETVIAAEVLSKLVVEDYRGAYLFLTLEIVLVIVRHLFCHFECIAYRKNYNYMYMNMQNKVFDKLLHAKNSNFNKTPRESLMSLTVTNLYMIGNFCDVITIKIGSLIQVITSIIIVFSANVWIGLAILAMSVINTLVLVKLNKAIAKAQSNIYTAKDQLNNQINKIIDEKDTIEERDEVDKAKKKYLKYCKKYCDAEGKDTIFNSYKDDFFYVFYKIMIFIVTCVLISLLTDGILTYTMYLIVTPYLLNCTELLNELINTTYNIEETLVSVNRINTVLSFTEEEMIKFGNIKAEGGDYNLSLIDVKYQNIDTSSPYYGKLKNLDMSFKYNALNIVKGGKNGGRRLIYNLLNRKFKPDSGVVILDGVDIFNLDKRDYNRHIFYAHTTPVFSDGSILKNFKEVNSDLEEIQKVCEDLGILHYIENLPRGINSNIHTSNIPQNILYMIGFARTLLHHANIYLINELPEVLNKEEEARVLNVIKGLKENHTVVFFTSSSDADNFADVVYTVEDNKVKDLKITQIK